MHQNDELAQGPGTGISLPGRTREDHSLIGPQSTQHLCSVSAQQAGSTSLDVHLPLMQPHRRVGRGSTDLFFLVEFPKEFLQGGLNRIHRDLLVHMIRTSAPEMPLHCLSFLSPFTRMGCDHVTLKCCRLFICVYVHRCIHVLCVFVCLYICMVTSMY